MEISFYLETLFWLEQIPAHLPLAESRNDQFLYRIAINSAGAAAFL